MHDRLNEKLLRILKKWQRRRTKRCNLFGRIGKPSRTYENHARISL